MGTCQSICGDVIRELNLDGDGPATTMRPIPSPKAHPENLVLTDVFLKSSFRGYKERKAVQGKRPPISDDALPVIAAGIIVESP
jgi:hypothetical protein